MNRLQKKCFIASISLHLLLALILFVGPAFLSPGSRRQNVQVLDFIPTISVEASMSSRGGSEAPTPRPEPPPAPAPAPVPPAPTPPPPVREVAPAQEASSAAPTERKHTVVPTLKPTVRNANSTTGTKPRPSSDTREADARQRIADQIRQTASGIRGGVSASTTIQLKSGGGGGGPSYASFEQTLLTIYDRAWIAPEGMDTSEAVVDVRVTVESDGRVSSSRIIQRSGDERVDRSVQEALDRVTYIPVPAGTKERRTVEFDFKSRAKLSN